MRYAIVCCDFPDCAEDSAGWAGSIADLETLLIQRGWSTDDNQYLCPRHAPQPVLLIERIVEMSQG